MSNIEYAFMRRSEIEDLAENQAFEIVRLRSHIEKIEGALKGMLIEWDKFTRHGSPISKASDERVETARALIKK